MWNDALPRNGITNWSVFTGGTVQSWTKPAGCSWVYFLMVGAGAGGGGPANGATTVGGGGGASGTITRLLLPATLLPDILYVYPGFGGAGSTGGFAAAGGESSWISIAANSTAQNRIMFSFGATGGSGTGSAGGAQVALTSASGIWMNVGLFTSIAGQNGVTGAASANTNGSNVTFGASGLFITGGAGGGNGTGNGGDITGAGLMPTISGGAGTTGAVGGNGLRRGQNIAPGFKLFPLLFSGGSGGGGHTTGPAGAGGNGSYGCGGGGGGGCSVSGTAGAGGRGGDGLILIGAF